MDLSIVVPAHEADETLGRCLEGIVAAMGADDEVLVIDDGSRRPPRDIVAACGDHRVRLVEMGANRGRGPARNVGLAAARHRGVVFIDADVVPCADAVDRLRRRLDEGSVAVFGSYDDRPGDPGVVSQYRNLLHHVTHHLADRTADHLFTGLAAVDADVVRAVGGFDEGRWSRNMEEVELGHRLVSAGHRIDVDPRIQGTHLKAYSVGSMLRTDVVNRAIPWMQFILDERPRSNAFVTGWAQRVSVPSAVLVVGSMVAMLRRRTAVVPAVAALLVFVGANRALFTTLLRRGGPRLVLASVPLHLLHTLSAVVGGVIGVVAHVRTWRSSERGRRER